MTDSSERPCRTGELFVCFSSRLPSYSSMKLSSKSILSPARAARDVPMSLSTSLSRRLRTNRSLRGAQSPMFQSGGKKRGCAFENPEPSSPKVTCIGQVRVRTKKHGKKMRTLSRRRGAGGEVSFRRVEQSHNNEEGLRQRNHRWVHLPVTICEALREFSCLFPCKSSCFSAKEEKTTSSREESTGQNSCGAAFVRWLVALHDGDGGKGKEVELVLGEEEEATEAKDRTFRRHAVEAIEIRDEDFGGKEGDEEHARLSVCVPPKNALLLMRCRSDPVRMSALANRLWEFQAPTGEEEEEEKEAEEAGNVEEGDSTLMEDKGIEISEELVSAEANEEENPEAEVEQNEILTVQEAVGQENPEELVINDEPQEGEEEKGEPDQLHEPAQELAAEDNESSVSCEAFVDPETSENEGEEEDNEEEEEETEDDERRLTHYSSSEVLSVHSLSAEKEEAESEALAEEATLEEGEAEEAISEEDGTEEKSTEEKETQQSPPKEEEIVTQEKAESEQTQKEDAESEEREQETHPNLEKESEEGEEIESSSALPECLLLMKCEPKLSMEVSKETWVCSRDFISWRRRVSKTDGRDQPKKRLSTDSNAAAAPLPPRLSCSAVTGVSVATMLEQKKLSVGGFEPFVLTRCKSEPMRKAAAKLEPEGCFWKNRHRGAVGAAGVGF